MHELGVLIPIISIIGGCWIALTVIRLKHRERIDQRGDGRLTQENAALRATVERLEKRIGVLETIAVDPATRTAHEIEQLRNS